MRIFKRKEFDKKEISVLSERYRKVIVNNEEVEFMSQSDFENLIAVAKYADLGISTAIQAAFCLGYETGTESTSDRILDHFGKEGA
ncbi:MAG: hypothetical protein NC548_53960 [Lachnospiraceae bacterium]|nr:hypothetical protein [Lachnospiraceae bacterium]